MVFGDVDNLQVGVSYKIVLVGKCTEREEHVFNLLKAGKLLKQSGFKSDKPALLDAIEKLNEKCEKRLMHLAECRNIRACATEDIGKKLGYKPYCEDARLSINNAGQVYKALYVPPDTPTITHTDREALLEALCACYDLSECKPKSRGPKWDAWVWASSKQSPQKPGH